MINIGLAKPSDSARRYSWMNADTNVVTNTAITPLPNIYSESYHGYNYCFLLSTVVTHSLKIMIDVGSNPVLNQSVPFAIVF